MMRFLMIFERDIRDVFLLRPLAWLLHKIVYPDHNKPLTKEQEKELWEATKPWRALLIILLATNTAFCQDIRLSKKASDIHLDCVSYEFNSIQATYGYNFDLSKIYLCDGIWDYDRMAKDIGVMVRTARKYHFNVRYRVDEKISNFDSDKASRIMYIPSEKERQG